MSIKKSKVISVVTVLMRLCVGLLFMYSGFVKGVDPWGTVYKVEDYLGAMGYMLPGSAIVGAVFALIAVEFVTGVFLLFGCCRRISVWIAAALMAVMLPLTLWVAVADPVPDCGCFGDAWVISNTATFIKNILLTAGVVWLLIFNRRLRPYITPSLQWIEMVAAGLFILILSWYGYYYQPAIDFRPYKVGEPLMEDADQDEQEAEYLFVYSKDGKEQQFGMDEIPDESEGWTFVRRQLVKAAEAPRQGKQITVYTLDGEDATEKVLGTDKQELLLMYPSLKDFNIADAYLLNTLHDYTRRTGMQMALVVSGSPQEIARFTDLAVPEYPLYTAEDTSIKEVARGYPSVVFLKDGNVQWKTQLRAMNLDDIEGNPAPATLHTDYSLLLPWLASALLLLGMLLVAFSLFPLSWLKLNLKLMSEKIQNTKK